METSQREPTADERMPSKATNITTALGGAFVGGVLVQGMWRLGLPPDTWPALFAWFGAPILILVVASAWFWKRDQKWFAGGLGAGAVLWTLVVLAIVIQFARGMEGFE